MKTLSLHLFMIMFFNLAFAQANHDIITKEKAKINGTIYTIILKNDSYLSIANAQGKTIFALNASDIESIGNFKFVDFNKDGYKDVLIEYMSNVPGIFNLLLYNKKLNKFQLVKDFDRYPAPEHIPHTSLYYSYHRSGCADDDWDSDLFKIVSNKVIKIGNITGRGCNNGEQPDGLYVYKMNADKKHLIKRLPIHEIDKYKGYKWEFIKRYWRRYYHKFI